MTSPSFRRGALDDTRTLFDLFIQTNADLERRVGTPESANFWLDAAVVARMWQSRQAGSEKAEQRLVVR